MQGAAEAREERCARGTRHRRHCRVTIVHRERRGLLLLLLAGCAIHERSRLEGRLERSCRVLVRAGPP